ncbi:MAG: phosphohistidine phosphatase SixA [Acidobacteria bacterium]|nr:phosphohistidine phosphatase SixA [Acidobacteriota bacterium]
MVISESQGIQLILIRHGSAEDSNPAQPHDDAARRLTDKGKRKMREISKGLCRLIARSDWIVTSPLIRAKETAEIVAMELPPSRSIAICSDLSPGGTLKNILRFISKYPECQRIILVGHETGLSTLAAHLIGATGAAGLSLKKGGCCLIRFDEAVEESAGRLMWLLTPEIVRSIR